MVGSSCGPGTEGQALLQGGRVQLTRAEMELSRGDQGQGLPGQ